MMMSSTSSSSVSTRPKVIDSHLHVWGTLDDSISQRYPYIQDPPSSLQDCATVESLLQHMERSNIDGALIVQPINYLYDHSFVINAMKEHPNKLKGMMLYDPTMTDESKAIERLEQLVLAGFVGVRFNPYLFPKQQQQQQQERNDDDNNTVQWGPMSKGVSLKVYQRCATLHIPVGIMCFQGLHLHFDDIIQLLEQSPDTIMILDHFAFTKLNPVDGDDDKTIDTFQQLIQLSKYPNVHVKISALFRMNDIPMYQRIYQERFVPILEAYSAQRLLYGSDFPYILNEQKDENDIYSSTCQLVASWCPDDASRRAIMGGNAERLFGSWEG
jgi:predicted TIM-barrel fold metal-dependent hydrolase